MSIIFALLLLVISIPIFLHKNGKYYIQYIYIWLILGPVVYGSIFYLEDSDFWTISTWCKRSFLLCFLILIFSKRRNLTKLKKGLLFILFIIIYYTYLTGFRGHNIIYGISYICGCFLIFIYLPIITKINVDKKKIIVFLDIILWFELIIGLIQYFYPALNYASRIAAKSEIDDISPIGGTLYGNNTYIEFILCLWFCMTCYHLRYKDYGISQLLQLFLLIFLLFACGIRIALIAAIPLFYYLFVNYYLTKDHRLNKKRLSFTILVAIVGLSGILAYFSSFGITYTSDATSGIERNLVLISIFLDNSFLIKHTTFGLSYDVLKYFPDNYIVGPGLLFQGNGYDGYINLDASNVTDATLAIYICETGIIGGIIFILFIRNRLKDYWKSEKGILYLIIALLILTITDTGIFSLYNLLVVYTMIIINNNFKIEHNDKKLETRHKKISESSFQQI